MQSDSWAQLLGLLKYMFSIPHLWIDTTVLKCCKYQNVGWLDIGYASWNVIKHYKNNVSDSVFQVYKDSSTLTNSVVVLRRLSQHPSISIRTPAIYVNSVNSTGIRTLCIAPNLKERFLDNTYSNLRVPHFCNKHFARALPSSPLDGPTVGLLGSEGTITTTSTILIERYCCPFHCGNSVGERPAELRSTTG